MIEAKVELGYKHHDSDFVTGAWCNEPEGRVFRPVYMVWPEEDLEDFLWSKLYGLPSMFGIQPLRNKLDLRTIYDEYKMWMMVDNVGFVGVDTRTPTMPNIHITFWDRRLRGREPLGRAIVDWVQENFSAPLVTTQMPASSKAILAWTKRVGFEITGWHSCSTYDVKGELDDLVELAYRGATYTV